MITLSQSVEAIQESATLAVAAKAAKMRAAGIDVVSFGTGEPDFPTPAHIVAAAKQALDDGKTKYPSPSSGVGVLKEAIAGKLLRENDLRYCTDQIVVTVGGKIACQHVLQALVNPGDEVIIPVPYWVSYPELVRLAGGVPVFVHGAAEDRFCITPDQLKAAITPRTRVFILNYPSNPAGHLYSPEQVRALAAVLAGTEITVLSDEIYDRLVFDGSPYLSFAAAGPDAYRRTLTVNSASKTYSMTGWRLGFVAGAPEVIDAVAKLQSQGTSGAATFAQHAYAVALNGDQTCVEQMRKAFAERAQMMHDLLQRLPGVRCVMPQGAFYVFPNVGGTFQRVGVSSSRAFAEKLLEVAHVAVVAGDAFGIDDHVRLSCATSVANLEKGLTRLSKFVGGA